MFFKITITRILTYLKNTTNDFQLFKNVFWKFPNVNHFFFFLILFQIIIIWILRLMTTMIHLKQKWTRKTISYTYKWCLLWDFFNFKNIIHKIFLKYMFFKKKWFYIRKSSFPIWGGILAWTHVNTSKIHV